MRGLLLSKKGKKAHQTNKNNLIFAVWTHRSGLIIFLWYNVTLNEHSKSKKVILANERVP